LYFSVTSISFEWFQNKDFATVKKILYSNLHENINKTSGCTITMNGWLAILFGAMQTVTMSCFISFPYFIKYKENYLSMFNLTLLKSL